MNAPLHSALHGDLGMVGISPSIERVRALIRRYARVKGPVVILGESGSGKELVARALHAAGTRASGPFVAVNAAALPSGTLPSELFGHARGAFTGAHDTHRGLFQQANDGTLFLDEVAELGADAQAQLLRVLETGEVRSMGSERVSRVDVRLVVAAAADLRELVARGRFRADLFHRIVCLGIDLPPLRARTGDLPVLAAHLLGRIEREVGPRTLTPEAHLVLQSHDWPGNVRELANVLYRAAVGTDEEVLDARVIRVALGERHRDRLPADEDTIRAALSLTHGNLGRAARALGMARSTLRDRVHRMDQYRPSS